MNFFYTELRSGRAFLEEREKERNLIERGVVAGYLELSFSDNLFTLFLVGTAVRTDEMRNHIVDRLKEKMMMIEKLIVEVAIWV